MYNCVCAGKVGELFYAAWQWFKEAEVEI
jgi:hypothetical protein